MSKKPLHYAQTPLSYAVGCVGEEGCEVAKETLKISRFGLMDKRPQTQETNLRIIQGEISDIIATVRVLNMELAEHGLPPIVLDDENAIQKKIAKLAHFGHRSMRNGTLASPLQIMSTLSPE